MTSSANGALSESARTWGINPGLLRNQLEKGPPADGGDVTKVSQETRREWGQKAVPLSCPPKMRPSESDRGS